MKQSKNKKNTDTATPEEMEAKYREEFTSMKPLRLRKYAVSKLKISPSIVDEWNDFSHMVDCCVAKVMGEKIPDAEEDTSEDTYNEEGEFDASGLVDEDNGDGDNSGEDFDDEMESSDSGMFADPDDGGEEEKEVEPEPEKPKARKKRTRKTKEKAPAPPADGGDFTAQLQGLLDVITNQGVVLDKVKDAMTAQKSTIEEIYVRQESSHRALAVLAKTVFKISAVVSGFVPRALKAMRFKPSVTKEIQHKAESAGKDAETIVLGLLDPEAD